LKELAYQAMKTDMQVAGLSQEMRDFKDEMKAFKEEMRGFEERAEQERREMNRRWGELANKMGTLAEDIVAPNLPRVARELFGCQEVDFFAVRVKKRSGTRVKEYDVIVACADYVLINETKSTLQSQHVDEMITALAEFREFFPEYQGRQLIGIAASLYVDESVVHYASTKGILVMGMGKETMEVFNREAVKTY
jgi:hypothetical protein